MIFEKIRERLQKKSFVDYEEYYTDNGECLISISEAFDIINQVEVEYNNGWISVDDRLPENNATVWITYIDNGKELTATAYYGLESGYWYVGYFDYKTKSVTHWQPLPKSLKGE